MGVESPLSTSGGEYRVLLVCAESLETYRVLSSSGQNNFEREAITPNHIQIGIDIQDVASECSSRRRYIQLC